MLEKLHAKRAVLVAQRDQYLANLNLTIGAIKIIDELTGEELAAQSQTAKPETETETETAEPAAAVASE